MFTVPSILNRFAVLDDFEVTDDEWRLRFVPDYFDLEHADPVLVIEAKSTFNAQDLQKRINAIKGQMIDDIEVDGTTVSIWIEGSDQPLLFQGDFTWRRGNYETRDHLRAIEVDGWIKSHQQEEILKLRNIIHDSLNFIDRTADRLKRKDQLSRRDDHENRRQLDLLQRVRRTLSDDIE